MKMLMGRVVNSKGKCLAVAALLLTGIFSAATNGDIVKDSEYYCGDFDMGKVTVTMSDSVKVFGGPFLTDAATNSYTILGGVDINATATTKPGVNKFHLAWLQAVTGHEGGGNFLDKNGTVDADALVAPWPDTPPGGYKHTRDIGGNPINPIVSTPFDNLPWYGNNKQGDLSLIDQPKNGVNRATGKMKFDFESWLVCVENADEASQTYDIIPLLGFTWGYSFKLDQDLNNNGKLGDAANEYTGSTYFGGFIPGPTGPTGDFINGYAKYFTLDYITNNNANCVDCIKAVPLPSALPMGLMCLALLAIGHAWKVRRQNTAKAA